jgi:hypothetical protein
MGCGLREGGAADHRAGRVRGRLGCRQFDDDFAATTAGRLGPVSQRSAQAACSARSLIPRSIFWLMMKLTASAGSTMHRAHGLV